MSYQNDREAYILAQAYAFCPFDGAKYEPDDWPGAETRWMILAHPPFAINILPQYHPDELIEPP